MELMLNSFFTALSFKEFSKNFQIFTGTLFAENSQTEITKICRAVLYARIRLKLSRKRWCQGNQGIVVIFHISAYFMAIHICDA